MLINSLQAINFRKYHKLSVTDIPSKGVITIEGSNESGKTSIGEAICFVLYGRTFFLDEENLHKIVCWGADVSEVTLEFSTEEGQYYELWRSVNREGETFVKLQKLTTITNDETKAIVDEQGVTEALIKILGFNYDAFANSFYLAQRELTSPDPHSDTIKQMAGISSYAKITDDFEDSNKKHQEAIEELNPQIEAAQEELDAIGLDETWLPELIEADEILGNEQKDREVLVETLKNNESFYESNILSFHKSRKSYKAADLLAKTFFFVSLLSWLLWVAHGYFSDSFASILSTVLADSQLDLFSSFTENFILPIAIISLLIFLICLGVKKKAKSTMQSLSLEAKTFASLVNDGHGYVTTLIETLLPERVVQTLRENDSKAQTLQTLPPREQFNNLSRLVDKIPTYQTNTEELNAALSRLSDALVKQDGEIVEIEGRLLEDISQEKIRSDQAGNLRSTLQGLNKVVDRCNYSIDTQNIAIGLMQRAAQDSVELFNKNIAKLSETTLPKFTESRYSQIRIEEDFSVQIFSDEKKDFMDFDEISSGTQRQVMLALRMAMSAELAFNTGNDQQFIFLDEPFAFFDQARTKATLQALPYVTDVISQIWISAQEFPYDIDVEKRIQCPLDDTELLV